MSKNNINEKWSELLDYAKLHATKTGMHTGVKWLKDAFNEYLTMSDEVPGYSIGGQPGSQHNRQVLAGKIILALGPYVGGRHVLDDAQLAKLKESLKDIVDNPTLGRGLKL